MFAVPPEPPTCQPAQLTVAPTSFGEAALQFRQTFTFVNRSGRPCSLKGWPRVHVQPAGRRFHTVRVVYGRPSEPPFRTVTLRPYGAASFNVYGDDYNAVADKPCPTTSTVEIRLPGAPTWMTTAWRSRTAACCT